ncbi:MAG: DUF1152 domain-containing protein [Archaeoglobaceae archaeon]
MEIVRIASKSRRALLFGIGGGGDIVSTIPVASFLKEFGVDVLHGSVAWDRLAVDPKPGPRSIEEFENVEVVNDVVAIARAETRTRDGVKPNLARAAELFGEVIAVDITKGVAKLADGLRDFADKRGVDLLIGVDAGGDAIATGFESGLRSPLADSICVAALSRLDGIVAVAGFGSDGELRMEELLMNMGELVKMRGYLGCTSMGYEDFERMRSAVEHVVTEASYLPLLAFEGFFGYKKLRRGRTAFISPLSILVFYFKASAVYELNEAARIVSEASDIEEANSLLHRAGILTELDFERAIRGGL